MSRDIPLENIQPDPQQPRKHFDQASIADLARTIEAVGLASPILLRPVGDGYMIVYGERRYRAAKSLGWATIPAEVRDIDPEAARWLSLVENVQRSDLSPIEEAQAYRARLDDGLTQEQLGAKIGKTQSYIAQKLRLLKLPAPLQFYLDREVISEGHARQLLRLRKFYTEEVITDLNATALEGLDLRRMAHWLLIDCRPEDNPACWFHLLHPDPIGWGEGLPPGVEASKKNDPAEEWAKFQRRIDTITEACSLMNQQIIKTDGKFSQWELTAFWWASLVVYLGLSVSFLAKALDKYIERIYSAIIYTARSDKPPTYDLKRVEAEFKNARSPKKKAQLGYTLAKNKIDILYWWGTRADVRHAGFDLDNIPSDVHAAAGIDTIKREKYVAPSQCQPWGQANEQYQKCIELEEKYRDYY